jgi:hypothetical protein
MTTQNIKGVEQRYGKPQKKQTEVLEIKSPFNETKTTVKVHPSRLEQVEGRISELKIKYKLKEKKTQKKS